MMRFYNQQHRFYCGVDLHARTLSLCILDASGAVVHHETHPATSRDFLAAIAPFRDGLVVACECMFAWYWLADLCSREGIPFVLGHALYMKAIHGGKAKTDEIDATRSPSCCAAACSRKPMSTPKACVKHVTCSAAAPTWSVVAAKRWPTWSTPTASTTSRP